MIISVTFPKHEREPFHLLKTFVTARTNIRKQLTNNS
jgi:hypothetical protein